MNNPDVVLELTQQKTGYEGNTNIVYNDLMTSSINISQSLKTIPGQKVYASTHTGSISGSVPQGSGHIVRVLGYALNTGTSNMSSSIYFNPDNTWIELA